MFFKFLLDASLMSINHKFSSNCLRSKILPERLVNQPGRIVPKTTRCVRDLDVFFSCNSSPLQKVHEYVFHPLIFFIHSFAVPNPTSKKKDLYFTQYNSSVLAFQKAKVNVNLLKSSNFSHFALVFLPKGLPRIIQNPNNPNRHKCQI